MSKPDRWWVRELISVCDPISLDPIRTLRHPPFELRADPAAAHNSPDSDWYDGQLLASYLVSTGNFTHPMSRRELTRAECAALDAYLKENRLCVAKVAAAFDIRDDYKKPGGAPGSRLHDMRTEADAVLQSLFAASSMRHTSNARAAARPSQASVSADGNMRIVDDDRVPSHATQHAASSGRASD